LVKRSRLALKEVSPQIEKKLQAEKLREELDGLKKKSGIWMDEQYFRLTRRHPPPVNSLKLRPRQAVSSKERG